VSPAAHSIGCVPARTTAPAPITAGAALLTAGPALIGASRLPRSTLTRRRAVDYCRVATALCRVSQARSQPAG
jgi:hypothetical protein